MSTRPRPTPIPRSPRRRFQRARHDDEKSRRRAAILDAADRLLREGGFDTFAMEPLARRAGIAKGTLYLYFETREEVLLSLHAQQLIAWSEAVTRAIRPGMSDAAFARTFFDASRADPAFLDLAARLGNVLEQNVSTSRLVESKQAMHAILGPLATHLERCLKLSTGSGVTALTSLTATLLGAVQLDAGPPLDGPDVPREVRELRGLFACRPVFLEAAQLLLAGLRARRS